MLIWMLALSLAAGDAEGTDGCSDYRYGEIEDFLDDFCFLHKCVILVVKKSV